jgi:FtsZ-binding cell division protein ZapB
MCPHPSLSTASCGRVTARSRSRPGFSTATSSDRAGRPEDQEVVSLRPLAGWPSTDRIHAGKAGRATERFSWFNSGMGRLHHREGTQPGAARARSIRGRIARRTPGIRGVTTTLDRTRAERDRLRKERDNLQEKRDRLRKERDRLKEERDRFGEPSFYALYESMKRQRDYLTDPHPIWSVNSKVAGRSLATSLGVPVPRLLAGPIPLERLEEPDAERFVVKRNKGADRKGLHALVRDGDRLWSVLDHRATSWDEVRGALAALIDAKRTSSEVLVEELLRSGHPERVLPFDWKCYCIGGRVELVMQRDIRDQRYAPGRRFKFWSPPGPTHCWPLSTEGTDLVELGPVRHQDRYDTSLPAPSHPQELIQVAERVAGALPGPFVRVDLYDCPETVVFGEITPHPGRPGTQRFTPDLDRRLGVAFERALAAEQRGR